MAAQLGVPEAARQTQVKAHLDELHRATEALEGAVGMITDRTCSVVIPVPATQPDDRKMQEVEARCDLAESLYQAATKIRRLTEHLRELTRRIEL